VANSLNNLAAFYVWKGQYAQAEPLYKRALAIEEKVLGPEHPRLALTLENIAEVCRETGRAQEAKALATRAARSRAIAR
jgi:hypothetical protein